MVVATTLLFVAVLVQGTVVYPYISKNHQASYITMTYRRSSRTNSRSTRNRNRNNLLTSRSTGHRRNKTATSRTNPRRRDCSKITRRRDLWLTIYLSQPSSVSPRKQCHQNPKIPNPEQQNSKINTHRHVVWTVPIKKHIDGIIRCRIDISGYRDAIQATQSLDTNLDLKTLASRVLETAFMAGDGILVEEEAEETGVVGGGEEVTG